MLKDRPVAAVVTDQRMPGMTGIEVLQQVRQQSPDSKLVLLTAYADTDVAIRAINDIALDYYLMKPWDPPEDRLYPVLDELLRDWAYAHPDRDSEVRVVGHRWSERTHDVKSFLAHNHVPYRWLEVGQGDEATRLLDLGGGRRGRPAGRGAARRGRAPRPDDRRSWPTPSGCAPGPSSSSTTCASWAPARPVSPPPCTPRPRGCRPSSWSATPRAGRPARARRSRTTSASPRASPAPT